LILPDVNVLLYAFRDDSVDHTRYRAWLEGVLSGDEAYGMSSQVLCSVARIASHPRIYVSPSRIEDAFAFARVLLEQPHCTVVQPGARHFSIFEDLCAKAKANGNLAGDALLRRPRGRVGVRMGHDGRRCRPVSGPPLAPPS
jgi:toxin-antitoxin system PIN domain toxin